MRGKARRCTEILVGLRITPAYAGKSDSFYVKLLDTADHPRLCGEKLSDMGKKALSAGSPPPMRGKVAPSTPKRKTMRITPAYAGKRCAVPQRYQQTQDHPRLCGEKLGAFLASEAVKGSPPPMRGKVEVFRCVYRY